jgi:hypothetical protein
MARSRRRDDDEDDAYEDRPRKRRRRDDDERDSGGSNTGLIVAGSIVGGLILVGGIIAAVVLSSGKKKKDDDEPPVAQGNQPAPAPGIVPGIGPGVFLPPKNNPPQTPKKEEPPKLGAGVVALPVSNFGITDMAMSPGGGANGRVAILSFGAKGNAVEVLETATGKSAGRIPIEDPFEDLIAVGPAGRFVVVLASDPIEGNTVAAYSAADGKLQKKFRPYPKKGNGGAPNLIWIAFTAADRLLTADEDGNFDLWSLPQIERIDGVKNKLGAFSRLQLNIFSKLPMNFALSPNRDVLAIFNGAGFSFHDTATLASLGKTPDFIGKSGNPVFNGTAFTPDGKQLASFYQSFDPKGPETHLHLWNAKTGETVDAGVIPAGNAPQGMAFWGNKHLAYHQGGTSTVRVIDVATKKDVGKVNAEKGKFVTMPPDGDLWAVVAGENRFGSGQQEVSYLVKAAPPAALAPGSEWIMGSGGLLPKVSGR